MKLCVLILLFHDDHLTNYIVKYLIVGNCVLSLFDNFPEHIFETDHIERCLLEWKLHHFHHHYDKVLDSAILLRHLQHCTLYHLQLLLKYHSTDVDGRVLLKRLLKGLFEILFAIVESNLQGLLRVNQLFQCVFILLLLFLQLCFYLVELFLLNFAHQ